MSKISLSKLTRFQLTTLLMASLVLGLVVISPAKAQESIELRPRFSKKKKIAKSLPKKKISVARISKNSTWISIQDVKRSPRNSDPRTSDQPKNTISNNFITLYPKQSAVALAQIPGFLLSQRLLAVRPERRLFYDWPKLRAISSKSKELSLAGIDLETGWVVLHSPSNFGVPPSPSDSRILNYNHPKELQRDWNELTRKFQNYRSIARVSDIDSIFETEALNLEERKFVGLTTEQPLTVSSTKLSPRLAGMQCRLGAPKVRSLSIQHLISSGESLHCQTSSSQDFFLTSIEAGALDFWGNRTFTSQSQTLLLDELIGVTLSKFEELSLDVERSTPMICQRNLILDSNTQVRYCTRTLRSLPSLQDTVAIFGKKSKNRFLYTVIHTGAMTPVSSKRIFQEIVSNFEATP